MSLAFVLFGLLPSFGHPQTADHMVISEVMYNPTASEPDQEWFELFNPTAGSVDLAGWKIKDNSTSQDIMPPFILGPGEYLVVAARISAFQASYPGFTGNLLGLESAIGNGLANGGDRILLVDAGGNPVDAMSYGSDTGAFNPACSNVPEGHSLARVPSAADTDSAADWSDQLVPNPGGSGVAPAFTPTDTTTVTPTPTETTTAEPTATATPTRTSSTTPTATITPGTANPGDVVVNEIMQNPRAVSDTAGEWFEIYNTTGHAIDLAGWTIKDAGTDHHTIQNGGSLWLPAGGYLVLGRNADPATNGGVQVAYRYTSFSLGNADDEIILLDAAGMEIDRVAYDGGPAFPNPDGASMQLIRPDLDNGVGSNWRTSPDPWQPDGEGDRGSPGAPNHTARIEGYVYEDLDSDRHRDVGEPGIPGVTINLSSGRTARTFTSGWYGLLDLAPGSYRVTEVQPEGYTSTTADERTVTLSLGQVLWGQDFGDQRLSASPTPTEGPSPTPTPSAWPRLLLSEVVYDAPQPGTDSDYEWLEVFNAGTVDVSLAGWMVGDNAGQDTIPAFTLAPGEYLIIAATAAGFAVNHLDFTGHLVSLEDTIGNGLGNTGDVLRLLAPDGTVVDAMSYGTNTSAFAPSCPGVAAGQSLARVPSWLDTDTAADWAPQQLPNPGAPGIILQPTPTPTASATLTTGPADTPTSTPTPTATVTPIPTLTPTSGPLPLVRLNEILPRPDAVDWDGNGTADAYDEWVEIVNLGPGVADLGGWALDDILSGGSLPYAFPPGTFLAPGEFLVRYRSTTGVALNQDADSANLLAPDGSLVDSFSYRDPGRDISYSRTADGTGDWTDTYPPSPGQSNRPGEAGMTATPTATPTATSTATLTPTAGPLPFVRLHEILPRPASVDWDGSGTVDAYDEFVEIVNLGSDTIDLGGWMLDDMLGGGSLPYVFPPATLLTPGEFLVRYRSTTNVALNQDADTANLLAPDGRTADSFSYADPAPDTSYSRTVDGTGDWTDTYPPSPGQSNLPGTPGPTETPTSTRTPGPSATPTATLTVVNYDSAAIRLNEVLPAPAEIDWNGDGHADMSDEWVELYDRGGNPVDLGGWMLDDVAGGGSAPYILPVGTYLQPGGFLLLFRRQTGVALNNDTDTVRLLGPDGVEVDTFAYTNPEGDRSYSRATDGDGPWTDTYPPSPGRSNVPATPTPTPTATATATAFPTGLTLNEILSDPRFTDWDQDGTANFADEFIELHNAGPTSAAVGGWALADDTKTYTIPLGTVIWPRGYLLLFRRQTGLSLSDYRDQVTLLRPDGSPADLFGYEHGPGVDRSFCRTVDGGGTWTRECYVTPGQANRILPPPSPSSGGDGGTGTASFASTHPSGTIAAARAAPEDTRVTLTGVVTFPSGILTRTIYIQEATGGIKVYLRAGDLPAFVSGGLVRVTGWTRQFHGETEISVPSPSYLTLLGSDVPPVPLYIRTGEMGETHEGRLVWLAGEITRFEPQAITVDDGSGPARIYFAAELPWRRPYVNIGEVWSAVGVVGQYAFEAPWEGGYRLQPRFETDVSDAPMFLPVTGGR